MNFEWDENKNKSNKKKHSGISFEFAVRVFLDDKRIRRSLVSTLKTMTLDDVRNLKPLTEEEKKIIRDAAPTPSEDCPAQTPEELEQYKPWHAHHPEWYKPKKANLHMKIDVDVLEWFRAQGKGYQTRINAVLREHVLNHQ